MTYDELKEQLAWVPEAEGGALPSVPHIVLGGMGGSALPAHAARFLDAAFSISTHRDYDLPKNAPAGALYIAASYSGNTAETLSFAKMAHERKLPLAAIASGGALAGFAREKGGPFVAVPAGLQPRNALFYQLRALLLLAGREDLLRALESASFDAGKAEEDASVLAHSLAGALPLFYASLKNGFLAYASKINLNETGKMPAAANVFPELNHNEMQSFDASAPEGVAALARFVLLRDAEDDPRVVRRMEVFSELMRARSRTVLELPLLGARRAEKLARGWFTAHRAARALALARGVDPDAVPLVEDFKKRL